MGILNQFRSVIQWNDPSPYEFFVRFTDKGEEIKNASKLVLQPGQGCIFTYEGKMAGHFDTEGLYDIGTDNSPFITTIRKFLTLRDGSEHVAGIWFYKKGDLLNLRWGTRAPITYVDPVYTFPVELRCFGNFSVNITDPQRFFKNVVAGQEYFCLPELQEVLLSRIVQPLTNYLANARFSYAEIDAHVNEIAANGTDQTRSVFEELGFALNDFRIEGTSFTDATLTQIDKITAIQADVKAAQIAGLDYTQMEKLKAMRDAAKNESGAAGLGMSMGAGMQMGSLMASDTENAKSETAESDTIQRLKKLKSLFDLDLISEEEYKEKKQKVLDEL